MTLSRIIVFALWIANLVAWIACGFPVMAAASGFVLGLLVAHTAHDLWGQP